MYSALTLLLAALVFSLALMALKVYGIVLCFKAKWYIGVVSILVPFFAEIVAIAKLGFKKDLLA